MFIAVTLLGTLSLIPVGDCVFRTCIPNTQFQMNGHICYCDGLGRWSDADCEIAQRENCRPGQIVWEDCNQCICQENGQMRCISASCGEDKAKASKDLDLANLWCLPFVSYYVNCSLCVCPASGKISEARCARDASCPFQNATDFLEAVKQNVCIPKVMYLFPCLQCHCSDDGFFLVDKCVETCRKPQISDSARRCIPETFYRKECNICRCPKNSIANDEMCSKSKCNNRFGLQSLNKLRNKTIGCHRNTFTSPTCFFCECNQDATVNEDSCLESECMFLDYIKNGFVKDKCSPGEMVPYCSECLCLKNGATDPKFCTNICSHEQKLITLDMVIKESFTNPKVINKKALQKAAPSGVCEPNSIYLDEEKYCLCPDNGNTKFKLCVTTTEKNQEETKKDEELQTPNGIDFSAACDPSTFVEYDCNTCYCPKTGQLDPKWCTYDDCEAKKTIIQRHVRMQPGEGVDAKGMCVPGSIIKEDCNFCICPVNGKLDEKACTKNDCVEFRHTHTPGVEKFTCEPLLYYSVDCNTCYCPKNGYKNLAICTKKICEKSFLRTDVCVPGELFGQDCNVCVCPPNGDKSDRVCTEHVCSDADTPWKKIFKLSQSLLSNNVEDTTRSLELCFPGEEYVVGCKICVCPDMGLRVYATCTRMLCEDDGSPKEVSDDEASKVAHVRTRRDEQGNTCIKYKLVDSSERKECTPGSIYVIRCRQCICPYMGNINYFCRPLPVGHYCEQAYPGYNYLPMGRRIDGPASKSTTQQSKIITKETSIHLTTFGHKHVQKNSSTVKHPHHTTQKPGTMEIQQITITHNHTIHPCGEPGRVMDKCFICDCVENVIVEEHCFKSDAEDCKNSNPIFLRDKVFD